MDLSNKSLALVLVASILLSLGGTVFTLNQIQGGVTGFAAGRVNLSITDNAECTVPYNVSFGVGTQPASPLIVSTEIANAGGFNDCATTATLCSGILINNTGNVDLVVNISSSAGAAAFLGGPSVQASDFIFKTENGSTRSTTAQPGCQANGTLPQGNWTNVVTTSSMLCRNLTYSPSNRQIAVEYNATLRSDTPAGNKLATLTITCITAT